jgi:uncharacterized membrane protein
MDRYLVNDYTAANIIERIDKIDEMLINEQQKEENERDREREFELIYAKHIQAMKLNTGYRFY